MQLHPQLPHDLNYSSYLEWVTVWVCAAMIH